MIDFAKSIIFDFWAVLIEMSPYLLFGFFVAGILSVLISQPVVERHLGGKGIWPVVKASLFGVPLPLCSCGVIPVSMSLHKHGASKAATISFLLSTPQTGVDSIFVTWSLLGPLFAIFRPLVAFVTGIVGGVLIDIFGQESPDRQIEPPKCTDPCCHGPKGKKISRCLKYGFVTLPRDIGRSMLIGLVVAAFISALVPKDFFAEYLGTGIWPMVVMMLVGIPVYVCATASVPIAAALMLKGLTPGAAIVFLMTGPATNAASLVTIWKILGSRTAIIYLLTVAGCALLSGILLDYFVGGSDFEIITHHIHAEMLTSVIKNACAVALITILTIGAINKKAE